MDGFPKPETNDFRDGLNAQGAFYAGENPIRLISRPPDNWVVLPSFQPLFPPSF
jgi:hypothetical protein